MAGATITGRCICGNIKVTIPSGLPMGTCHCSSCRRASGTTHSGNFAVRKKDLQLGGQPEIYHDKGLSGKQVYRNFCGECGCPAYTTVEDLDIVYVKAGLFEPSDIPKPSSHVFAKNMADWERLIVGAKVVDTQ